MTVRRFVVLIALVAPLGACGWAQWPPPQLAARPAVPPPSSSATITPAPVDAATEAGVIVVRPGDSVHSLSRLHQIPIRALIEANNLRSPFYLTVGQRLILPRSGEHITLDGDTVYGVARQYGVNPETLARINSVDPTLRLDPGKRLRIPTSVDEQAAASAPSSVLGPQVSTEALLPPNPIASRREPPVLTPPGTLPPSSMPSPSPLPSAMPPVASLPPTSSPSASSPPPAPRTDVAGFIWPVNGDVVSAFGPKGKGQFNDGINIAAPLGAAVRAVENGTVAYAGNELRGFGNLLLIKHANGWTSAYAHNNELLVKPGDRVSKGQTIALVGATGSVGSPQLHFELRRGKSPVDPQKHLARGNV